MRWPRSIGGRLTLWYAAAFAAALVVLGVAMWVVMQQSLYHAIDEGLRDRMQGINVFIEDHKTRLDQDEVREEFRAHGALFQVVGADGVVRDVLISDDARDVAPRALAKSVQAAVSSAADAATWARQRLYRERFGDLPGLRQR